MKIVADTNTFIAVAMMGPERDAIISATRGHELVAPEILPYETGNALISMMRKGALSEEEIGESWETIRAIPVELYAVDIRLALRLAVQCKVYAYDAYFLACAASLRAPVLTLDRAMQRSARTLQIPVVELFE